MESELNLDTVNWLAVDAEGVPSGEGLVIEDRKDSVVIPLQQMGWRGVWIMTAALACVSTPLCYWIAWLGNEDRYWGNNPWLLRCGILIAWLSSVFGPLGVCCWLPREWWDPEYFLSYSRQTGMLSYLGGIARWEPGHVRFFLVVSGYRAANKRYETELQVCAGEGKTLERRLILAGMSGDPVKSYGEIVRVFANAMRVPAYLVRISKEGTRELVRIVDEPGEAS